MPTPKGAMAVDGPELTIVQYLDQVGRPLRIDLIDDDLPSSLDEAIEDGFKARVRCSRGCEVELRVSVSARTARTFDLRSRVIARSEPEVLGAWEKKKLIARLRPPTTRKLSAKPGRTVDYEVAVVRRGRAFPPARTPHSNPSSGSLQR